MMRLDAGFAFQNIRPDRALGQEGDAVQLAGLFGKDVDEFAADDVSLLLRVGDARQLVQEAVSGIHVDEVRVHLAAEHFDHLFGFALAQQAVVHVHTNQLLAHGFDEQGRHDGGIHAAGQSQKHFVAADLPARQGDLLVDEGLCQFGCGDALHVIGTSDFRHICFLLM